MTHPLHTIRIGDTTVKIIVLRCGMNTPTKYGYSASGFIGGICVGQVDHATLAGAIASIGKIIDENMQRINAEYEIQDEIEALSRAAAELREQLNTPDDAA